MRTDMQVFGMSEPTQVILIRDSRAGQFDVEVREDGEIVVVVNGPSKVTVLDPAGFTHTIEVDL